jgi:hypothetical protein
MRRPAVEPFPSQQSGQDQGRDRRRQYVEQAIGEINGRREKNRDRPLELDLAEKARGIEEHRKIT